MAITDIFLRFRKQIETSAQQHDEQLKTHYYKGSFNQLFQSVEEIVRQDADCRITTVSKEHGEIAVEVTKPFLCQLLVTVVSASPLETAVDFTISSGKISILGIYPELRKRIISFYERINQQYTHIGNNKNSY